MTTNYLVDTNNLTGYAQVVEEIQGGNVVKSYTYGHDLISQRQGLVVNFYGYDGHGSVRNLTDNLGNVTDTYAYDAFGNLIERTGATENNYLYAGEQFDADLGFYYNRARYLNTGTGRFISMDPHEGSSSDALSLHKYLYANNNPANRIDPSGNMSHIDVLITSAIIGALAGGISGYIRGGVEGAIKGAVVGAIVGVIATYGIIYSGVAVSAIALKAGIILAPQVASFAIGTIITAWQSYGIYRHIQDIDLSDPNAESEIAASYVELGFMILGYAVGAVRLGQSARVNRIEGERLRPTYEQRARDVVNLNEQLKAQGVPLRERAYQVWASRHQSRVEIRGNMSEFMNRDAFSMRDMMEYGNPDGPTFEYLIQKAQSKGLSGDQVYEYIISSGSRTNAAVNQAANTPE